MEGFKFPARKKREYSQATMEWRAKPHSNRWKGLHDAPNYEILADELEKSDILLIRHANSISNNLSEQLAEHFGVGNYTVGDWIDVQFSPEVVDSPLSEKGIQ